MYTVEVEQIIKAQEQGRLLILPTMEEIQERGELCGFCKVGECSQVYSSKGFEYCEGTWCDEAYINWLRSIYDAVGIEYNP